MHHAFFRIEQGDGDLRHAHHRHKLAGDKFGDFFGLKRRTRQRLAGVENHSQFLHSLLGLLEQASVLHTNANLATNGLQ